MKKLLKVSLVAVLAVAPFTANAALTQASKANIAANTNVATTSFVGGAHDELVDIINPALTQIDTNTAAIGTLTNLTTTEKTSLVGAINEVKGTAGFAGTASELSNGSFQAADKTSAAAAANAAMTAAQTGISNAATAQSAADAAQADADALEGRMDTAESDIDTLETSVGTLTNLTTTEKTSLVGAINEVVSSAGTQKGFAVYGTWGQPTTATGHVNVVNSTTLNP